MLLGSGLEKKLEPCMNTIFRDRSPVMNSGFINWNMLVLNMEDELAGRQSMDAYIHACEL